jgi:MFS family permease
VPPLGRRAWQLLGGVALFEVGTGMTLPLVIVYLHRAVGLSLSQAGIALAAMGAGGLAGVLVAGWTADRWSALGTALVALGAAAIGSLGFLVVHDLPEAALASAVQGAGFAATFIGVFPLLIRSVEPGRRSDVLGTNYGVTNLGLGLGAAVAGLLLTASPAAFRPLFVVDALSSVAFAVVLVAARTPTQPDADGEAVHGGYLRVARDGRLLAATGINLLLVVAGYSQTSSALPAWVTGPGGLPSSVVGYAFAANTWTVALAQLPAIALVRRVRRTRAVGLTGILFAACWLAVLAAGRDPGGAVAAGLVIAGVAVFGLGEVVLSPSLPAIVNDLTGEASRGRYTAFYALSWQAGPMIGPPIGAAAVGAGYSGGLMLGLAGACLLAVPAAFALERVLPPGVNRVCGGAGEEPGPRRS